MIFGQLVIHPSTEQQFYPKGCCETNARLLPPLNQVLLNPSSGHPSINHLEGSHRDKVD